MALIDVYRSIVLTMPENFRILPPLLLVSLGMVLYGIVIWKFYRFLARRDIIKLDLKKYNKFQSAGLLKFFAVIFYIIEFLIILPFVICIWFAIYSIMMVVLAKEHGVSAVLMISAAVIAAVRITAYYSEDLSKDLSKMFPFTLLGIAILSPNFFNSSEIISRFSEIPSLLGNVYYYAIAIIIIEIFFRLLFLVKNVVSSNDGENEDED